MVLLLWRRNRNRNGFILGEYGGCSRNSHCQRCKRSVTAAAWLIALSWRMMVFCATKCRRYIVSPCNYDFFAKVKEPLRGTRYNTRDEIIHDIGRSIRNINKDGRAEDGVRRLPNIWQKMINKGATILKVHKCCTPVNKAMSEISNCCHYFSSNCCNSNKFKLHSQRN